MNKSSLGAKISHQPKHRQVSINLVVIGHKDHGKSTLIGRLLYDSKAIPEQKMEEIRTELKRSGKNKFEFAFLLDTLEEERKDGLTIDIMQMPFKTEQRKYTIIDCPGHREFIKKMITGASQADAAILVVSAKEGIEDQTKQHIFLAKMLGINQLIVAVNKMDQVNYDEKRFNEMYIELDRILKPLGYREELIIPISAMNGDNILQKSEKMQWYNGLTLIDSLDKSVKPPTSPVRKPLRGFVQDVYVSGEERTIICKIETGTLESGKIVIFEPSGVTGPIKRIEVFGKNMTKAKPGDSIGLIVNGAKEVKRGEVISYLDAPVGLVNSFVAEVILFSNTEIKPDDILTIRCGTAEKKCKVRKISEKIDPIDLTAQEKMPDALKEGEVGKISFSPLEPMCIERHSEIPQLGRFVIEGDKGTMAAGIVLEIEPLKK